MANIAKMFKDEISRIAKKEIRLHTIGLKQENIRLKKAVAQLRKSLDQLEKNGKRLARKVAPVVAAEETQAAEGAALRIRPTSKTVRKLRAKFGVSQADFGRLLGVSLQTVANWEGKDGRVKMRSKALEAFASAMNMGAREAKKKLAETEGSSPAKSAKPSKAAKKKAKKKTAKMAAAGKTRRGKKKVAKKATAKKSAKRKSGAKKTKS